MQYKKLLFQDLKRLCWGGTDKTISNIWSKQGLVFKPELKLFAYGLKLPKNETKNFLMCFQAFLLKEILFAEEDTKGNKKYVFIQPTSCNIMVYYDNLITEELTIESTRGAKRKKR